MSETAQFLHDLIEISRDGTEFYEEAAKVVEDKKLSRVFIDIARAKSALADNLSSEIKPDRKRAAKQLDLVGEVQQTYTDMRGEVQDINSANITALEATESLIQNSLQKVVMDRDNNYVVRVLAKQYVSTCENLKAELRSRKRLMR